MTSYHSDNGKELQSMNVKSILANDSVIVTSTSSYTPQENCYVERHNRTEIEGSIAMMQYARQLPKNL